MPWDPAEIAGRFQIDDVWRAMPRHVAYRRAVAMRQNRQLRKPATFRELCSSTASSADALAIPLAIHCIRHAVASGGTGVAAIHCREHHRAALGQSDDPSVLAPWSS